MLVTQLMTAGTDFISDIFSKVQEYVPKILALIKNVFESVIGLFWTSGTGLTTVGGLALLGAGFALFYMGVRFIRGLIRVK